MWTIKTFKTRKTFDNWLERNRGKVQWREVFVNNAYAVEYRKLRKVY